MMMYSTLFTAIAAMLVVLSREAAAAKPSDGNSPSAIALGNCADFAIMAGTAVSFNGVSTSVSTGAVGVSPGNSITGSVITNGYLEANTAKAQSCASSMITAYNAAKEMTCQNTAIPTDLGGLTLEAGVYCNNVSGTFGISAGKLTLTGTKDDVWIFQTTTSVTTAASRARDRDGRWSVGE